MPGTLPRTISTIYRPFVHGDSLTEWNRSGVRLANPVTGLDVHSLELALVMFRARFLSWLIGRPIDFQHIGFRSATPAYADDYAGLLPRPYQFKARSNEVAFD